MTTGNTPRWTAFDKRTLAPRTITGEEWPIDILEAALARGDDAAVMRHDISADTLLQYACEYGRPALVEHALTRGASDFERGLVGACAGGERAYAKRMIALGAKDWNRGFHAACIHGQPSLAEFMCELGATNVHAGLAAACYLGRHELVAFAIDYGIDQCANCDKSMAEHRKCA